MKKNYLILLLFFLFCCSGIFAQSVAYWGTIFVDGTIITDSDPSAFKSIKATGRGQRTVFDRRTSSWNSINAYLFRIEWTDGLVAEAQVNPEFGDSLAKVEAEKYAVIIGRIPTCLRKDVQFVWIHKGQFPFGGGNHAILIHTEQSAEYEKTGILEETLVHEASHTSLDDLYASSTGWTAAQKADVNYISTYAKDNPVREDVAETFLMWVASRQFPRRISQANVDLIKKFIPNRLAFLDQQKLLMSPLSLNITGLSPQKTELLPLSPNPFSTNLTVSSSQSQAITSIELFNMAGQLVLRSEVCGLADHIDTTGLICGLYLAKTMDCNGVCRSQKLVKI